MPPPFSRIYDIVSVAAINFAAGVETVAATLAGLSTPDPQSVVRLIGVVVSTGLAGTTTSILRIRRNDVTGLQVASTGAVATAGANTFSLPIIGRDVPGDVDNFSYVITLTCAGANGANVLSGLFAIVG